jgi:hypothetical protein
MNFVSTAGYIEHLIDFCVVGGIPDWKYNKGFFISIIFYIETGLDWYK